MSRLQLGRRDRRALLVGTAAIAAAIALARGVPAYLSWLAEARGADAEAQIALAGARAILARSDSVRDSAIARGRRVIALAPAILGGDTPNMAGASLAGLLSGAAALNGVRTGSIQVRSDSLSRDAFTRIGAHLEATGDVRGITNMLTALEDGPTLLVVRSLAISQSDPAAGDDRVEALRVELDVEGLMLNPRRKQ
jgi:hypothetical protein